MENRLDIFLFENNYVPSRSKALSLIKDGKVMVDNKIINKPAFKVYNSSKIEILESDELEFVSRGGLKLKKALKVFNIDVTDKVILDIGASTGGFTDCLLKNKAKLVYALDVGTNQLHESLKDNPNVISLENLNFKDVELAIFKDKIDLLTCDVSFISLLTILKKCNELWNDYSIICLFKPQFEVGKKNLNNNGVVKNKNIIIEALYNFKMNLDYLKIGILDASFSPILGNKEGNTEYLFYLKKNAFSKSIDFKKLVNEAFEVLKHD